ncbi:hypothetical protein V7S57_22825 [Caulobacter sp. CCNWLY153]|uniref:nSTAND1 domain-containing NTPase n=1 Tax=unclassified Caulobacter TaxID=2648921 RepID=UPI002FF3FFF8
MASALRYSATLSLPAVRAEHLRLLQGWSDMGDDERRRKATALRHTASDLGKWLQDPAERDTAQGVVDYWTSALAGLPDEPFPDLLRLAAADPEAGAAVEARARTVYDGLTPDEQDQARKLFLRLLGGPVRLDDARGDPDLDRVRRRFQDAGVIVEGPGDEGLVIAHRALLIANWPQLDGWSADRALDEAMVLKLEKSGVLWRRYRRVDDLLRGRALSQALPYREHSSGIADYIDASLQRRIARRVALAGAVAGAVLVTGGFIATTLLLNGELKNSQDANVTLTDDNTTLKNTVEELIQPSDTTQAKAEVAKAGEPPGVEGYIWIGGQSQALLARYPDGERVTPGGVVKDGVYRARANIALRQGYPDENYNSAPRTGVVGDGALLKALDAPVAIARPSGPQYWLHVRQAITVYIQYRGRPEQAAALRRRLLALGYDAPEPENRSDDRIPVAQVRYFRDEETPFATRLRADLAGALGGEGASANPSCRLLADLQPDRTHVLEVWVDFTARRAASTAQSGG